jgi:hypothetical protein
MVGLGPGISIIIGVGKSGKFKASPCPGSNCPHSK